MGNGSSSNLLRPEAGPVPFNKLQNRVREALNRIIPALTEAAKSAEVIGREQTHSEIDTYRASRLFFVSGEPGSGKSTVYLTLRVMTSAEKKFEKYGDGYDPQEELNTLKGAVRWLEPLDLEVAGDERDNLLAAVLVRLFDALDRSAGILPKPCEAAIKELEELATDIGIAWEGNLRKRAGSLDPATYSEEVMLAQRARLGVNNRLRQALDNLAKTQCCGCHEGTLFVLPVEDFYLKPDASLQLLRLLRMISAPRLFFLLMGDIKTVEALFTEKSLADWTAVAGTKTFIGPRSERLNDALSRARELRARYLRKLLPPGQRVEIEAMDWFEALDFEVGRPSSSDAVIKTLEDWLEDVKLDRRFPDAANETSLLSWLIMPPFTAEQKTERKQRAETSDGIEPQDSRSLRKDRTAYTAVQILDATPREIMDLGSALREVIRKKEEIEKAKKKRAELNNTGGVAADNEIPLLLSCVRDIVDLVREEQSFLSGKEQEVLEDILPTTRYAPEDINLKMDRLCLKPDEKPWRPIGDSGQWWIRKHRSWELRVNKAFLINSNDKTDEPTEHEGIKLSAEIHADPYNKLPPRPAAWFVLLHDLAWTWNPDCVTGNLIESLPQELQKSLQSNRDAAQTDEPPNDFGGWAVRRVGPDDNHFPIPEFHTFQELDRFLHIWNSGIEWLDKLEAQAVQAERQAVEQQKKAHGLKEKAKAEADIPEAKKEEELADEMKQKANQAWEQLGIGGQIQVNTIISLWKLAGCVVFNERYKDFAARDPNWFKEQTTNIEQACADERSQAWLQTVEKFFSNAPNNQDSEE